MATPDAIARVRAAAGARSKPAAPAPVMPAAPTVTLAPGFRRFEDVFGWAPTLCPEIPVRTFEPTDWPEDVRPLIPSLSPAWEWPREATERLAAAIYAGDRTLLTGPTGTGKTALAAAYAAAVGAPFFRIQCFERQSEADLLGMDEIAVDHATGVQVSRYAPSLFVTGLRSGGVIVLDEAFRAPPGVLMAAQSVLEAGGRLVLPSAAGLTTAERTVTPDWSRTVLLLTDNTKGSGDETGTYVAQTQDASTLSRITATVAVPYPAESATRDMLVRAVPGIPEAHAAVLAAWAARCREAHQLGTLTYVVCLRKLLAIAAKARILTLDDAVRLTVTSQASTSDATVLSEVWHQITARSL